MDPFEARRVGIVVLAYGIGHLGCWCIWWSIELDHAGYARWLWEPLGRVGDHLRAVPTLFGLPPPEIPDF